MAGIRRGMLLLGVLALAASCAPDVEPGQVTVRLTGVGSPRAAVFRMTAVDTSGIDVPVGQPVRVFTAPATGDSVTVMIIADQGQLLTADLVTVNVPDRKKPPGVRLDQLAGADYSLLALSAFTLTIGP